MLLGILFAVGPSAQALTALGLDAGTAERLLAAEFTRIQARRKTG